MQRLNTGLAALSAALLIALLVVQILALNETRWRREIFETVYTHGDAPAAEADDGQ